MGLACSETARMKGSPTFTSRDSMLSNLERTTTPLIELPLGWRGNVVPALCPDKITVMPLPCLTYGHPCEATAGGDAGEISSLSDGSPIKETNVVTGPWSDPTDESECHDPSLRSLIGRAGTGGKWAASERFDVD
jgi:hypothetical protein